MSDERDEPRVREILEDEDLAPETIARLAAWFGGPAPDEAPAPDPEPSPEQARIDDERERMLARRQRAMEAVEPGLLSAIERRGERYGDAIEPLPPLEVGIEDRISRFDPGAWRLGAIGEPVERQRPEDIGQALEESTPQAILRDLHRPVRHYGGIFLVPMDPGLDLDGERARREVEHILAARYHVDIRAHPPASQQMTEAMTELRAELDRPWAEVPRHLPQRQASLVPGPEDMKWFGAGGYDPDL